LSLPRFLGVVPGNGRPYLSVDRERIDRWHLGADRRFRVGLIWAGNPQHPRDRQRSMAAENLRVLADTPGVELFSLQQGANQSWMRQLVEPEHEMADTAAMLMNLDLVISVDTMLAHLAGALGRPVWILLPLVPD